MDVVGGDQDLSWTFLSSLGEATDVDEISSSVVLEASAVDVLEDVEVVE